MVNNITTTAAGLLPVIVHPTQLVPVLPAASQSVVKHVLHTSTSVPSITSTAPPVIVKTEQGISEYQLIYLYNFILSNFLQRRVMIGAHVNLINRFSTIRTVLNCAFFLYFLLILELNSICIVV